MNELEKYYSEHAYIICAYCKQPVYGNHSCTPFLLEKIAKLEERIAKLEDSNV